MITNGILIKFEEEIKDCFLDGFIRFPVHLSGGNERQLIEIFKEVKKGDWVFSTHRNHYHALLSGFSKKELKEWILKNGSMHVYRDRFFTSGIVGGILSIAVGVAMGSKRRICGGAGESLRVNQHTQGKLKVENAECVSPSPHIWVFVGDMAAETGMFHECTKYALNHDLPITFIVEDNNYSVDTITSEVWHGAEVFRLDNILRYDYQRTYPHQGVEGKFVIF